MSEKEKTKKKSWLFIILILGIVLILGIILALVLLQNGDNKKEDPSSEEIKEETASNEDEELQEYINNIATQYGSKVKFVDSINDLNATSNYKTEYYKLDSIDNMNIYAVEIFNQALLGPNLTASKISELSSETIIGLFLDHFSVFVEETYVCYKNDLVIDEVYKLYDYKLESNVESIYTHGDYYCSIPKGGYHPGNLTKNQYSFDGTYHIYNYEWTNSDNSVEKYTIKFVKKDELYKLYSIEIDK